MPLATAWAPRRIAHRRIDVSGGGGTYSGDTDWADANTLPNAYAHGTSGTSLAQGGVRFVIVPPSGQIWISCEPVDSMEDDGASTTIGAFLWSGQILIAYEDGDPVRTVVVPRELYTDAVGKHQVLEDQLPPGAKVWLRVTGATGLGSAAAIWVTIDEGIA